MPGYFGLIDELLQREIVAVLDLHRLRNACSVVKSTVGPEGIENMATRSAGCRRPTNFAAVALVVPCHRVIQTNGELGGYRWGVERKKALLEAERKVRPSGR